MIQLTETEKKICCLARKSTLQKFTLFLPHLLFVVVDVQVHMASAHDLSKGQINLSKNKNLTAISKKG